MFRQSGTGLQVRFHTDLQAAFLFYRAVLLPFCREALFTHRDVKVHKIIADIAISLYNNPKFRA